MIKRGYLFVIWIYLLVSNLIKVLTHNEQVAIDWKFFASFFMVAISGYFIAKLFDERCK